MKPGQCVQDMKLLEQLFSFSVLPFSPPPHGVQQHEGSEAFSPKFLTEEHLFELVWQLCPFLVHLRLAGKTLDYHQVFLRHQQNAFFEKCLCLEFLLYRYSE